jgi:hypothetical protein
MVRAPWSPESPFAKLVDSGDARLFDRLESGGYLSERALGAREDVVALIERARDAFPTQPAPGQEFPYDLALALERAGYLSDEGRSAAHLPPPPPPEFVVEMRDQDGGRSRCPGQFPGWMDAMKPDDSLTFVHKDGGQLVVKGPAKGPFTVTCTAAGGAVVAEGLRVYRAQACAMIEQYIWGDPAKVIGQLGPGRSSR